MIEATTHRYHRLKIWPEFSRAVFTGEKTCEIRKADRDYRVGDYLLLEEFERPDVSDVGYTGRRFTVRVGYIQGPLFEQEGPPSVPPSLTPMRRVVVLSIQRANAMFFDGVMTVTLKGGEKIQPQEVRP